jgi:hypothetical protein
MKRNLIGTFSLVALSMLLNTTGAYAQPVTKADVPFAFQVGTKQLPAGCYKVTTPSQAAIQIVNCNTSAAALSPIRRDSYSDGRARLVFRHVGNQYFLTQVWGAAGNSGMILPASKPKKELLVASGPSNAGEEIVIALK